MAGPRPVRDSEYPEVLESVECPEPVEGLSWVYVLQMGNGMLYVGQTKDVAKRIERHANGSGSQQAKQLKQFALVFVEGPMESATSIRRERQLKKWSRAKKLALIIGDLESLKNLSKSRSP